MAVQPRKMKAYEVGAEVGVSEHDLDAPLVIMSPSIQGEKTAGLDGPRVPQRPSVGRKTGQGPTACPRSQTSHGLLLPTSCQSVSKSPNPEQQAPK